MTKVVPQQWSHHHTERLFHVSFFMMATIVLGALLANMVFLLFPSEAYQITAPSESVTLTAEVIGISSGPTTDTGNSSSGGGGGAPALPTSPASPTVPANPTPPASGAGTVTLQPFSQQSIQTREVTIAGKKVAVPVLETNHPRFLGNAGIPNATITFTIAANPVITGSAHADSNGNFIWESPPLVQPGLYLLQATAYNLASTSQQLAGSIMFYSDFQAAGSTGANTGAPSGVQPFVPPTAFTGKTLFDIFANVQADSKHIQAGQEVSVDVAIVDMTGSHALLNVPVSFIVENMNGDVVLSSSETIAVQGTKNINKVFYTATNTEPGQYLILVEAPSQGTYAVGSDAFTIDQPQAPQVVAPVTASPVFPMVAVQICVGLFFFFLAVAYVEYRLIRMHSGHIRRLRERDWDVVEKSEEKK